MAPTKLYLFLSHFSVSASVNLAKNKPTKQSSTYDNNVMAGKAVNGDRTPIRNACSITKHSVAPWWYVDLGKQVPVKEVEIVARAESCGE